MKREAPRQLDLELIRELYPIAVDEYRFAVSQNSDRQKFFVGLNIMISSVVPALSSLDHEGPLRSLVLVLAAMTAGLGIVVIEKSHAYYRRARAHFKKLEDQMGLHALSLGITTTPGMDRSGGTSPKERRFKVYRALQFLLLLLLSFDLYAAWLLR